MKSETTSADPRDRLLKVIVVYKLVKACTVLGVALVLAILIVTGVSPDLYVFATHVREHATAAWALKAAHAMVSATDHRHLIVITAALFLDAMSTGVEWYALARGQTWGEWFVVAATSLLLPFEAVALARDPHAGRLVLLLVNVAIVLYLVRHALHPVRARAQTPA